MSIEQELFSWDGWDGDPECMIFYKPKLLKPIGKWPIGSEFDMVFIRNADDGCILQLTNNQNVIMGEYRLHYAIGETLQEAIVP